MNSRWIELEKVWFILMLNLKTVCSHIDYRWQVFLPQYAEFSATTSNAVIWKTEDFFWIFFAFLKCAWNLEHFERKDECPSLIISEIIVSKGLATETSTRSCFRTPFGNQRVNGLETPLKVARHHYYPLFPWISFKLSSKKTALLLS